VTGLLLAGMQPSGQGSAGLIVTLWWIVGFGAIFYFILYRPQKQQQKRHDEMLKQVKRGDEIVTSGGLVGEVVHVKDEQVTIKSGESRLVVERKAIARITTATAKEPAAT
jgi:preprotein translocase subunit YajC